MPHADRRTNAAASDRLDRETFAALFQNAYGRLWMIAAAILGDRTGAEDVVQESALVAWEKIHQFQPGTNFVAWLARFVRWHALNAVRKHASQSTHPADPYRLDMNIGPTSHGSADLDADMAGEISESQTDFDDEVVRALRLVSPTSRACMLLRTVHQLSYREIAELLEIPEGTAMSHVHRTRQILRDRLKSNMAQGPRNNPSES